MKFCELPLTTTALLFLASVAALSRQDILYLYLLCFTCANVIPLMDSHSGAGGCLQRTPMGKLPNKKQGRSGAQRALC